MDYNLIRRKLIFFRRRKPHFNTMLIIMLVKQLLITESYLSHGYFFNYRLFTNRFFTLFRFRLIFQNNFLFLGKFGFKLNLRLFAYNFLGLLLYRCLRIFLIDIDILLRNNLRISLQIIVWILSFLTADSKKRCDNHNNGSKNGCNHSSYCLLAFFILSCVFTHWFTPDFIFLKAIYSIIFFCRAFRNPFLNPASQCFEKSKHCIKQSFSFFFACAC